jgi:hypothetical protein
MALLTEDPNMTVDEAQRDISRAYVGGGPGVFVSAMVWMTAGLVERSSGIGIGFAVLFVGGMLIFPLSLFIARLVFRRAGESPDNGLARTALESTVAMIGGLFAAWLFLPLRPAYVFPLAAIAVGTHYAVFKTIYGDRLFWLLGGLVTIVGLLGIFRADLLPIGPIFVVAAIELVFSIALTVRATRAGRTGKG